MEDRVDADRRAVGDARLREVALDEFDAPGERREVLHEPRRQIVDDAHGRAVGEQAFHEVRADEAGAAGDEIGRR